MIAELQSRLSSNLSPSVGDDAQLRQLIGFYINGSNNPDMIRYGGTFLRHFDNRLHAIREWMSLARMYESRVLDIGCGFGWYALCLSILGRNDVVANDIRPLMTGAIDERIDAVGQDPRFGDMRIRVSTLTGDICTLELEPESFDAVVCNQTVEHVRDLSATVEHIAAALRRGGRCIITNDNNVLNTKHMAEVQDMWQQRDRCWEFIEELKRQRPIENSDIEPYAEMRRRIVQRANPQLDDEATAALVDATAGMIEPEIDQLARRYRPGDPLPSPPEHAWCRNPVTGEYCERQLDPYELRDLLEDAGLRATVRHQFRRFPLRICNGLQLRPVNQLLFELRPGFLILGEKP